jgi:DNA helicase HerA-like ATPase
MIYLGRSVDENVNYNINMNTTHRILICGKTGSGKSYTMGVILEELAKDDSLITLVVDSQGIFWSLADANEAQETELWDWNLNSTGFDVNLLVPGDPQESYGGEDVLDKFREKNITITPFRVNPSDVTGEMWCELFNLDINELRGISLYNAVRACKRKYGKDYFINQIIDEVENDIKSLDTTKAAVVRCLNMASDWEVFESYHYKEIWELLDAKKINILDMSVKEQSRYGIRNLVVAILSQLIFKQRTQAKRREMLGLSAEMPNVLMAIDEAQNYCPSSSSTLAKDILIKWAKEGRQPGLSLLVASQQPSAIDSEILSQCDIKIIHKITSRADRVAIDALSEDYIKGEISNYIKQLPNQKQALILDDNEEKLMMVCVRPRISCHSG